MEQIVFEGGRATGVRAGGETLPADAVISTVTTRRFLKLARGPRRPLHASGCARIPTIGIFCLFLRLTERVTPFFWVNANDPRVPFAGMIEYTNLNPLPELGGDHILYVPQYLSADDPRYAQTDEEVLRAYTDALALINPALRPPVDQVLRRVPRPLRPAHLPHRLPDHDARPSRPRSPTSS